MMLPDLTDRSALPDDQLEALRASVVAEQVRRSRLDTLPVQVAGLVQAYQDAAGTAHTDGEPYVPVTSYMDAYPAGSIVVGSDGNRYVATQDGAWADPTTLQGWRREETPGTPTPWTPRHAGEEDSPGALVTFQGHMWRNDLTDNQGNPLSNGFQPGQTGSGWTDLGPVEA